MISVVIPTRNRAAYLDVALGSLANQECDGLFEVLVVDDGSEDETAQVASRRDVRYIRQARPLGLNAARNAGVRQSRAPLIAFIDDDLSLPRTWLAALAAGAARYPDADAFGGPIRARFEGPTPSSCGRERPPITTLDLGVRDVDAAMVWGANMAIRRSAFQQFGAFDESIAAHGDEEDWLLGLRAAGGRIVYIADAGVEHRRTASDARLRSLVRAAYARGRAARRTDERRRTAPPPVAELRTMLGCGWHTLRYRCPQGWIMGAHSAGRLAEALTRRRISV